jgi:hypothetical protein
MFAYVYITLALLSSPINHTEFAKIEETTDTCIYEEYRICYIPDHCIYFQRTFDTTNLNFITDMRGILYYDLLTDMYVYQQDEPKYKLQRNQVIPRSHPIVKYYKQLEVESSSIPLYNTNYTFCKTMTKTTSISETNEWFKYMYYP